VITTSVARSRPITGVLTVYNSSVGKKYVMAITGIILFGYVVLHLWGNLKIFLGPAEINGWGVFLRVFGAPVFTAQTVLWVVRLILLAALVMHVAAAYQLTRQDLDGRPRGYSVKKNVESTIASRTMRWGGVALFLFIIFHVLNITTGTIHPGGVFEEGNDYHNLVFTFSVWYMSLIYIVAVIALGLHVWHGVWSLCQTLGWNSSRSARTWRFLAAFFAIVLTLGNIAIPVAVMAGIVHE
jgi:succinate dehydrogenase / fumarate reductase, cytochrome b subunit